MIQAGIRWPQEHRFERPIPLHSCPGRAAAVSCLEVWVCVVAGCSRRVNCSNLQAGRAMPCSLTSAERKEVLMQVRKLVLLLGLAATAVVVVMLPIAATLSWPRVMVTLAAVPGIIAAVVSLEIFRRITRNTLRWNRWQKSAAMTLADLSHEVADLKKSSADLTGRMKGLTQKIASSDAVPLRTRLNRALSANAVKKGGRDYLRTVVQPLLDEAQHDDVTPVVMWQTERHGMPVRKALSFRSKLITMSEAKKVDALQPSWLLNTKNSAYGFVDRLGVRRPKTNREAYPLSAAPLQIPGVIKALHSAGSRGTYLVFSSNRIVHVQDGQEFDSPEAFRAHAEYLMSGKARGRTLRDQWMVEELILEDEEAGIPARNLKFYCFYGEAVLMHESRKTPDLEVAFWSADNTMVATGKYEANVFNGIGFTPEQKDIVERISLEIPYPFVRIDMLNGEHEIVFGEFTPRPGNFDLFNDHWDRLMGEAWARAEARLLGDLLNGKRFDHFLASTRMLNR